ncbi:hypothetical protein [Edaphobacter modestus]|uniref:hypothetical protein n=1 Tax=Edaphobacter modestus TaxID=388466 RepID=UPI00102AA3C2|nr:hypothetical protein [Edaphobacter modestus]
MWNSVDSPTIAVAKAFTNPMKLQLPGSRLIGRAPLVATVLSLLLLHHGFQSRAWSQNYQNYRVGYPSGPLPIPVSADELRSEFQLGEPGQREDLLKRLGVHPGIAHEASVATTETTIKVDSLEGKNMHVLFLPCTGPGVPTAHLLLLRPVAKQGWRVAENVPLDCWYGDATYELLSIPGHVQQAVLAHHVNLGHGSGYVQNDMLLLFAVDTGHLSTVLRTAEYSKQTSLPEDKTVEQQSTLQPFPDGSLEETRATTFLEGENGVEKRLIRIERRRWSWDKTSQSFVSGEFTSVTD